MYPDQEQISLDPSPVKGHHAPDDGHVSRDLEGHPPGEKHLLPRVRVVG